MRAPLSIAQLMVATLPTSNISWIKNGRVISTTIDEELVISVAPNDTSPFGQYVCLVNNSVTTMETSILINRKVIITVMQIHIL